MKIELRKETKWDGMVFYWIYKDEYPVAHEYDEVIANERYENLIQNAKQPPVVEVLKQTEI